MPERVFYANIVKDAQDALNSFDAGRVGDSVDQLGHLALRITDELVGGPPETPEPHDVTEANPVKPDGSESDSDGDKGASPGKVDGVPSV